MSRFDPDCVHLGYMDGLLGKEPSEVGEGYEKGWLAGAEDRAAGMKAPDNVLGNPQGIKVGDMVVIPKGTIVKQVFKDPKPAGRTYKVRVNHFLTGTNAYIDWSGQFHRPTWATVRWAGKGGYWSEAAIEDVRKP